MFDRLHVHDARQASAHDLDNISLPLSLSIYIYIYTHAHDTYI